jgi:hypothetical protein
LAHFFFFRGRVYSAAYQHILEYGLIPTIEEFFGDDKMIFQQDLAPCHISKSVKTWLKTNTVDVLPWAANSPDLNLIETVWHDMKTAINKCNPRPSTLSSLKNVIQTVWDIFPISR